MQGINRNFAGWRLAILSLALLFGGTGCRSMRSAAPGPKLPPDGQIRSIWVTRWDYRSASDIAKVMDNCQRAGFNTVLFQVRGNGTVLYPSRIEPWSEGYDWKSPGYDPLAVAITEAHRRGMQLHAWVNVIPGWRGKEPPSNPRQLFTARPDWFWHDAAGRREPMGWYQNLNPCYPEVRQHLTAVMHEIVSRYAVDGLHMDYLRYPNEWHAGYGEGGIVPDYPRDPRTLAMFRQATGRTPDQAPELWRKWRADQLTLLVQDIRNMVNRTRPGAWLSSAVKSQPEEGYHNHFQDSRRWVETGLLDAVYPMNYARDPATYNRSLSAWQGMSRKVPVVVGVMFDKRDERMVMEQVAQARRHTTHFAAFAYNSLYERLDSAGKPIFDEQSASRDRLRKTVLPILRRRA